MDRRELTWEQIQALDACVEVATPTNDDEISGPVSDEDNAKPFHEWMPDRIAAVAHEAVKILRDNFDKTH